MRTMKGFRQSAMTRPLFEEPTEEIERPDAWSGAKGFIFGGMALRLKWELGEQFLDAANALIQSIKQNECEDYRVANPALFLYRHWLELTLKSILDRLGVPP